MNHKMITDAKTVCIIFEMYMFLTKPDLVWGLEVPFAIFSIRNESNLAKL